MRTTTWLALVWLMAAVGTACGEETVAFRLEEFALAARVPVSWEKGRDTRDERSATVGFLLPARWSESDRQEVRNLVSISAHRRRTIASRADMLDYETFRLGSALVSDQKVESPLGEGHAFVTEIKGYQYITFAAIDFRAGVGYVIAFTATNGTHDANLPVFLDFLATVELPPEATPEPSGP